MLKGLIVKKDKKHKDKKDRSRERDSSDNKRKRDHDNVEDEVRQREAKMRLSEQISLLQDEEKKTKELPTPLIEEEDAPQAPAENAPKREEWMSLVPKGGLFSGRLYGNDKSNPQSEVPKKEVVELNPYFKNGGVGLPTEDKSSNPTPIIGDGGASWRAKALKRAKENQNRQPLVDEKDKWTKEEMDKWSGSALSRNDRERARRRDHSMDVTEMTKMKMPEKSKDLKWTPSTPISSNQFATTTMVQNEPSRVQPVVGHVEHEPVDQEQLNRLAAKALKAQMMGDQTEYERLSSQIEELKSINNNRVASLSDYNIRGERIIKSDHNNNNQNELRDLVLEAKEGGVQNFDVQFAKDVTRRSHYEEYMDEGHSAKMFSNDLMGGSHKKVSGRREHEKNKKRELANRNAQIKDFNKQKSALEGCNMCFKGSAMKKHLVIALGNKTYLSIPSYGTLTPGHCLITTTEHHLSICDSDEDEILEIKKFKLSLLKMFAKQNKDVIFLETVTPYSIKKQKHCLLECIPIPYVISDEGPSYFKKAIVEAESDWNENPKIIDTTGKGIKRSVPGGFPYFHVEFGSSGRGYAHIIENENKISYQFGKEIIAGMLRMPNNVVKSMRSPGDAEERKQMLEFVAMYQNFDWTVELE
ncbi:hypothetical protein AKO1_012454 [Acrasis kona]|uniref:CWF19-like protein 2 n=1 Tax=Acrasis kona TaxID=1008807 RepID=A0AAW2YWU7_9EUKA